MFRRHTGVFLVAILLVFFAGSAFAQKAKPNQKVNIKSLPKNYQQFLQDVTYIITNEEKDAFLRLSTDVERDRFEQRFWDIRNPNPGAPNNTYKDEHYARIAYANQNFHQGTKEGWRTAMGQVYITLGPPKQRAPYKGYSVVYPMEIWFYSGDHPALPPYFYVIFYQRDIGDEYRLYSPMFDGPQALVTTDNNRGYPAQVVRMIGNELGNEVARTTISLDPTEPVDLSNPQPTMTSDLILNNIKSLANNPMTKDRLEKNRRALDSVHSRVILGDEYLHLLTAALKDADGQMYEHYALRLNSASDFAIGKGADGRAYYNVTVTARVSDANGKLLFTQETPLKDYISDKELETMKARPFGVEGKLPLAPGKYKLSFTVANVINSTSFKIEREIVVPLDVQNGLRISDVIPFMDAEQLDASKARFAPFTIGGVRFLPAMQQDSQLAAAQDLNVFYQIWSSGGSSQGTTKFSVEYKYGRLGASAEAKSLQDDFARNQLDAYGSLISGKKISTVGLPSGNYRLAITLIDPVTGQKAYASSGFHLGQVNAPPMPWDVYDETGDSVRLGLDDLHRGITYEAQGNKPAAVEYYKRALAKDASNDEAKRRLAAVTVAEVRP